MSVITTVALGTAAPLASVTIPRTDPRSVPWGRRTGGQTTVDATRRQARIRERGIGNSFAVRTQSKSGYSGKCGRVKGVNCEGFGRLGYPNTSLTKDAREPVHTQSRIHLVEVPDPRNA